MNKKLKVGIPIAMLLLTLGIANAVSAQDLGGINGFPKFTDEQRTAQMTEHKAKFEAALITMAKNLGVSVEALKKEMETLRTSLPMPKPGAWKHQKFTPSEFKTHLSQLVKDGKITQAQADEKLKKFEEKKTKRDKA